MQTSWQEAFEHAKQRWPGIGLAPDDFFAHLRALHGDADPPQHADELYLACACAKRDEAALKVLEESYLQTLRPIIARVDARDEFLDEVLQMLRHRLFVGSPGKLAGYTGKGPLRAWLGISAGRIALDSQRTVRRRRECSDELAQRFFEAETERPENRAFLREHAPVLERVLTSVLRELPGRERNVLRLHYGQQLNIDAIGRMYDVHRATVARWIAGCRKQVIDRVRARLRAELGPCSDSEFESMVQVMRDELELSLSAMLASDAD